MIKIITKSVGTDMYLKCLRVIVEISSDDKVQTFDYYYPLDDEHRPSSAELEKIVKDSQGKAMREFGVYFPSPTIADVPAPAAPVAPVAPAPSPRPAPKPGPAPVPPAAPAQLAALAAAAAAKLPPPPPPPPPGPKPAPKPAAKPPPPPPPAAPVGAVKPAPQESPEPEGIVYDRKNAEHTDVLRRFLVTHFGTSWFKDQSPEAKEKQNRVKELIDLIHGKAVVYTRPGETATSFIEGVRAYLVDGVNTF